MLIKKKYWIKLLTFSNLLISSSFLYGAVVDTEEAVSVAKKLANPVADLVAVPIQYNFNRGMGSNDVGSGQSVVIEPVYPVNLPGGDNLIIRPIVTAQWLNNVNGFTGVGMGNIQVEMFYSPKPTSSLIWGVGPYLITPSGSSGNFGPTVASCKNAFQKTDLH
jgi:hypothetical protein